MRVLQFAEETSKVGLLYFLLMTCAFYWSFVVGIPINLNCL